MARQRFADASQRVSGAREMERDTKWREMAHEETARERIWSRANGERKREGGSHVSRDDGVASRLRPVPSRAPVTVNEIRDAFS